MIAGFLAVFNQTSHYFPGSGAAESSLSSPLSGVVGSGSAAGAGATGSGAEVAGIIGFSSCIRVFVLLIKQT